MKTYKELLDSAREAGVDGILLETGYSESFIDEVVQIIELYPTEAHSYMTLGKEVSLELAKIIDSYMKTIQTCEHESLRNVLKKQFIQCLKGILIFHSPKDEM